jgi:transcriptional regulator with XRE-family HTH domain
MAKSKPFGILLRQWLKHKNMSQAALAELTGCSRQAIEQYCAGCIKSPGIEMVRKFAAALGMTDDEFLRGVPK